MHIKFIALIFVTLALLAVTTTFAQHRLGGNGCECSGRPHSTRRCCEESGGFLRIDRCHHEFSDRFLRCCKFQGLNGVCFT